MQILGARGAALPTEERLAAIREFGESLGFEVQLLDARLVCGLDHLLSAAEHAERATREGTNVAKTLAVEFVVYASGERQIAPALAKMGIRDDTREFALILFGDADSEEALRRLDLVRDDSVLEASRAKVRAFGIGDAEAATVPPERLADLVLERVARVDLEK